MPRRGLTLVNPPAFAIELWISRRGLTQATPSVKTVTPAKHIAPPAPLKDGEKYPGDPYAGKCVYALVGESEVHYC